MVNTGMNQEFKKVERRTKALVKIFDEFRIDKKEDNYEKFCEIGFSHGMIVKGCQFTSVGMEGDIYHTLIVYYEIEKDRVEQFKSELRESGL